MSKPLKVEKAAVFKHKHCPVCQIPIPINKEFCSPKCEGDHKRTSRRRTFTLILMLITFPLVYFLLIVGPQLGR